MMQATICSNRESNPSSASWNMAALGSGRTASRSRSITRSTSTGRVGGSSSAAPRLTAISGADAGCVPLRRRAGGAKLRPERRIVVGELQPGDQAELRERLGRLDHAPQRLVDAVAQLVGQAGIQGQ